MKKSAFSPEGEVLREVLNDLRKDARLTHRALAAKLQVAHSLVARILMGERRLDFVEYLWYCRACDADPVKTAARIVARIGRTRTSKP